MNSKSKEKKVIFIDELQWFASNQSKVIALLKKYWDQSWKKNNVMLILCGSISSFMIHKVIKSKALYGRINKELKIEPLAPNEMALFFKQKRSLNEILQYSMTLGGVPKYLEQVDLSKSYNQNIQELFFKKESSFVSEYEKIFYSQFKEHKNYEKIVYYLSDGVKSLQEISDYLKIKSGGGLKSYLNNLLNASFIIEVVSLEKKQNSKEKKYKLSDEFLRFYFKFIKPNLKMIHASGNIPLSKSQLQIYFGFSLELFCIKNALLIAKKLGFADLVINFGPLFHKTKNDALGFQFDLAFIRSDKTLTLCEIKFSENEIPKTVVHEMEEKIRRMKDFDDYTLEKVLITNAKMQKSLRQFDYFHHYLDIYSLFNAKY